MNKCSISKAKCGAFYSLYLILQLFSPIGISPMENSGGLPRESQLRQSRATQPKMHAECFSVSIIHRTLKWTTGSLTYAQILMHAVAHGFYGHRKRVCTES